MSAVKNEAPTDRRIPHQPAPAGKNEPPESRNAWSKLGVRRLADTGVFGVSPKRLAGQAMAVSGRQMAKRDSAPELRSTGGRYLELFAQQAVDCTASPAHAADPSTAASASNTTA